MISLILIINLVKIENCCILANIISVITSLGLLYSVGCYCSEVSQIFRNISCFTPLEVSILAYSIQVYGFQRCFQVRSSSGPLRPVSRVHGVISSRDSSISGVGGNEGQQQQHLRMSWEWLWKHLTINPKDRFSCLVLGFLFDCLWVLWGTLSFQMEVFHWTIYVYTDSHII